jgi:glycosyltransferase involved in cell wall biosynthesis
MNQIKVSIIVPVHNVEAYLEKCLDSLLAQTLEDIEILVINDSSPDNSQSIIDRYVKANPKKIKAFLKPNGGIADTRNYGLSKVTGEYFGFLDSDDTVEPTMFEKMFLKAQETNSDVVFSDFWWTYPDKEKRTSDGLYRDNKDMLTHMFATLWNKLYRTAFIRSLDITFPVGYRYEDASFLYKIAPYIKTWAYINEPFVHYLQREGSITHNHNEKVKDMIHVFDDLLLFYHQRKFYDQYQAELEYLFIRFFLGNSFKRTCQIKDADDRKRTLDLSFDILHRNFPNWKANPYLKKGGLKDQYYRTINRFTYKLYATLFHFLYQAKN